MVSLVEAMKRIPDFIGSNGRDEYLIVDAEEKLKVKFSSEYKEYLKKIGLACFDGHELTGLCSSSRLNVINVTQEEKKKNLFVPMNWYVVEQANVDNIVIWQSETGEVYQTIPNTSIRRVGDSLLKYFNL